MEALHYVAFDRRTNGWSIGVQAFTVGTVFAQTRDLRQLGYGIMRSLMSEVQHCVNIAVLERTGVLRRASRHQWFPAEGRLARCGPALICAAERLTARIAAQSL